MSFQHWGLDEIQLLRTLFMESYSYSKIAQQLNARFPEHVRTRNSVAGQCFRLGMTSPSERSRARIIVMEAEGDEGVAAAADLLAGLTR